MRILALAFAVGAAGCGSAPLVERAYDGHVVEGRFIEPGAYAAFLQGAIAEASGDLPAALAQYERANRSDGAGPETWARIGAVRCAADARDPRADDAIGHALSIDPNYAGAWTAKARCALARKDEAGAAAAAHRAAALDPSADGANALLARAGEFRDASTRDALVSLTETAHDRVAAWDALAAWASSHGDVALWARALERLVKIAPARRDAVARSAEELAGSGELAAARSVAAAAVEAGEGPFDADARPLAARLAVDEVLGAGDARALQLRATRARVSLEEAGARALLAGRKALARAVAGEAAGADPDAGGARLVVAASEARDFVGAAAEARRSKPRASGAAAVGFGVGAAHALSPEDERATLQAIAIAPLVPGDDRVERPAVELASRGVLDPHVLTPDGQVELAALHERGEGPALPDAGVLDARHEYLALALSQPQGARARELGVRLAGEAASDPVVAAASAIVQIANGAPIAPGAPRALLMRDPRDPLLAATALRLATKTGDSDVASLARQTLATF